MNIDFVVTWLDSNDFEWQKEYEFYKVNDKGDKSKARFRDMNFFQYWFRAVEKYAPWVNKVFLITNGKFPDWINKNNPKLVLVKHEDYIPKEFLPTFNSITIELHMHKIKGLSEHFVYFNDDMILNAPVTPDYYFKEGLPCDLNKETCFNVPIYTERDRFSINMSMLANIGIINSQFRRLNTVCQSPRRWFGPHLGASGLLISLLVTAYRFERFVGFKTRHTEQPFLKSVFEEAWEKEPDMLAKSCTRFREDVSLSPYFFRYWQLATNRFYPVSLKGIEKIQIRKENVQQIADALTSKKIKSLCLNDCHFCTSEDFVWIKKMLQELLEEKFPRKSAFEK